MKKTLNEMMELYNLQNEIPLPGEEAKVYDWYQKGTNTPPPSDGCCCCSALGADGDTQFECCGYSCCLACMSI